MRVSESVCLREIIRREMDCLLRFKSKIKDIDEWLKLFWLD